MFGGEVPVLIFLNGLHPEMESDGLEVSNNLVNQ